MFKVGDRPVPGYRLVRAIGRGQYGEVWESEAPGGARVALKFIPLQSKSGSVEVRAVQAVKRIRHANLVPVHAIWILDQAGNVLDDDALNKISTKPAQQSLAVDQFKFEKELSYLVIAMALADESLEGILRERVAEGEQGIPRDELIEYMRQAAKGIDFLNEPRHEVDGKITGITHRDVKPANLLLVGDSVVVGDFGVATTLKEFDATATNVVGSLGFMAPESIAQKPSTSTDQYALAITYYRLRTGGLPYDDTVSVDKLIEIHRTGKLEFKGVPREERAVLQMATSQRPEDRFRNCAAFIAALTEAANPLAVSKSKPNNMIIPIAIGAVILVLAAIFIWQPWRDDNNGPVVENGKKTVTNDNAEKIEPPTYEKRNINFDPSDAEFTIVAINDGKEAEPVTATGNRDIPLSEEGLLRVSAEAPSPFYESIKELEISTAQIRDAGWTIKLPERTVADVRDDAFKKIANNEIAEAITLLTSAGKVKPEVLDQTGPMKTAKIAGIVEKVLFDDHSKRMVIAVSKQMLDTSAAKTHELQVVEDVYENLATRTPNRPKGVGGQFVERIMYSSNSDRWIICRSDSIWSWQDRPDQDSFSPLWQYDAGINDRIICCDMSADGQWIAAGDSAGKVRIWNVLTDGSLEKPIEFAKAHAEEMVKAIAFVNLGNSTSVVSVGIDGKMKRCVNFLDESTKAQCVDIQIDPPLDDDFVAFTKMGDSAIVLATADDKMTRVQFNSENTESATTKIIDLDSVNLLQSSPKGKWLAIGTTTPSSFLQLRGNQLDNPLLTLDSSVVESVSQVAFSDDESLMAFITETGVLFALELDQRPLAPIKIADAKSVRGRHVAFVPGTTSVCGFWTSKDEKQSEIELWDLRTELILAQAKQAVTQ